MAARVRGSSWPSWSRIAHSKWRGSPWRSGGETVSALGFDVPTQVGAWAFCLLAVGTAAMLARAAWSREP